MSPMKKIAKMYRKRFLNSRLINLLAVFGLFFCGAINADQISQNSDIVEILKARIDNGYNIGIVVAVISPSGTKFYAAGKLSRQQNSPFVDQHTLFPIASITKVFTTLLFAEFLQNNSLKLNDFAQDYLPKTVNFPKYQNKQITLEQLATHTSGLPVTPGVIKDFNTQKLYDFLNHYELMCAPGTQYEYSDLGMGLLGDILSQNANMSYENLVKIQITHPLNMEDTKIDLSSDDKQRLSIGYNATDQQVSYTQWPILKGAGALYSSAYDLSLFLEANLGIKKTNLYPAMLLTHKPRYSEGKPAVDLDFPGVEKLTIGLGWNIDELHKIIWKNGNIPGFSSFIGFDSHQKLGVVVLANTGNVIYTDNLGLHILNPELALFPVYKTSYINPKILDLYSGKYRVSDGSYYIFIKENNCLKAQHVTQQYTSDYFNIYPMSHTKFFGKIDNAVFRFKVNKSGSVSFVLDENGTQKSASKIFTPSPRRHCDAE